MDTKAHKAKILKISIDSNCRLCKAPEETVSHILTGCPKIAQTEYLKKHNSVAGVIHKNICDVYNIATTKQAWLHKPGPVTETEEVKSLVYASQATLCGNLFIVHVALYKLQISTAAAVLHKKHSRKFDVLYGENRFWPINFKT